MNTYNDSSVASDYLEFLDSENGKIQTRVLAQAITHRLNDNFNAEILDAACGSGWLAGGLSEKFKHTYGCDSSEPLIKKAEAQYPGVKFDVSDLSSPLPYQPLKFDFAILNMAILDLDDAPGALTQISRVLKSGGKLIITLPNPYYNYPLGVWKAGALGKLLLQKPSLKLQKAYFGTDKQEKNKTWGAAATSYTKSLQDYINTCIEAGFGLTYFHEIKAEEDSKKFNLQYQLYRFPLLLLLEFKKI